MLLTVDQPTHGTLAGFFGHRIVTEALLLVFDHLAQGAQAGFLGDPAFLHLALLLLDDFTQGTQAGFFGQGALLQALLLLLDQLAQRALAGFLGDLGGGAGGEGEVLGELSFFDRAPRSAVRAKPKAIRRFMIVSSGETVLE